MSQPERKNRRLKALSLIGSLAYSLAGGQEWVRGMIYTVMEAANGMTYRLAGQGVPRASNCQLQLWVYILFVIK
jgi:hypothetical protein